MHQDLRVLIVGAGIAGLAFANSLTRQGIRPVIVEIAPTLRPEGLGLAVTSNGMLALRKLGLADDVCASGVILRQGIVRDALGNVVLTADYTGYREPIVGVYRDSLINALTRGLDCEIKLGRTLRWLEDRGEAVEVQLDEGSSGEYDLVVGADGLHSRVGPSVFGTPALSYRGHRAWRCVVPRRADENNNGVRFKPGIFVGTFPVSAELQYIFALEHGLDDDAAESQRWRQVHRLTSQLDAEAADLGKRVTPETPVIYTPVYEVLRDQWVKGSVALIGDAAHAMVPFNAQGASMAMEDAVVLGDALAREADIPAALRAYQERRIPRIKTIRDCVDHASKRSGLEGQVPPEELANHPGHSLNILDLMDEDW